MIRAAFAMPILALLAGCGALPESQRQARGASETVLSREEVQACMADLGRTNANFTPLPDRYFGAGCATLGTVRLASLTSDTAQLSLTNLGPVTCPLAQGLAGWARFGVDRAAQQILGSSLTQIETMGSYNCRTIAGTERLSAHATANAIDVAAFVLADGRRISVLDDWNSPDPQVQMFLRTVHSSACKRFATVLGPHYNAAHADHIHLESGGPGLCR